MPDFSDANKLGSGKEMVDRLTNLIAIFEDKALDFSKNRAEGDDLLGDAYEYLMRHFATQSGKSKGQFYTPAEVSRIMAQVIGIHDAGTTNNTTVYDPTCGSGSLLLKVADLARAKVTLYGQENDAATAGLARMNMILQDNATALIEQGNSLGRLSFWRAAGKVGKFLQTRISRIQSRALDFCLSTWRPDQGGKTIGWIIILRIGGSLNGRSCIYRL